MAKRVQNPPKSFEGALAELEKILADIEAGQVPLEETLIRYERGQFLIGYCRQVLGKAEKQIEMLGKETTEKKEAEREESAEDCGLREELTIED